MNFPYKLMVKGKGTETLGKNSYKGAGGEGTILQKGPTAYKIYHDPHRVIPLKKIEELEKLKFIQNVLGPEEIVLDHNNQNPIGFTMKFVDNTEYICRLFNRNFRDSEKVTPEIIAELVKNLQKILIQIHAQRILVVDYNEMNFLVDKKSYVNPYYIDVDSYQTPNFKATAIMESVRDRTTPRGQFNEMTDWFSFGVVAFQLYMGIHPFKGKHPDYKPKDWSKRMDNNISVFDTAVTLPPSCQDWSVIPKPHYEWFKRIFQNKERSIPPFADQFQAVAIMQPTLIPSTDVFDIKLIKRYNSKVISACLVNGVQNVITREGIYVGNRLAYKFTSKQDKIGLAEVRGKDPLIINKIGNEIVFKDNKNTEIARYLSKDAMEYQGKIYSTYMGSLNEITFISFGSNTTPQLKKVCNVFEPTVKLFKGVAVQDILGTCWLAIPYQSGACSNIHVKELDKLRTIDAKYENGVCIIMGEKKNKYYRYCIIFDSNHQTYTIRENSDIGYEPLCFTTLPNGICINVIDNQKVEVFKDNTKIKVIENAPFDSSIKIFNDGSTVMFIIGNNLHSVRLK